MTTDEYGTLRPPNLSIIKQCATQSIAFGAPAYNKGDKLACFRFYYNTIRSVVKLFRRFDPTLRCYSAVTREALGYFEQALEMCKYDDKRQSHKHMVHVFKEEEESPGRHAWRLRFALDRVQNLGRLLNEKYSSLRAIASMLQFVVLICS